MSKRKPRVYLKDGFWEQLISIEQIKSIPAMFYLTEALAGADIYTDISEKGYDNVFLNRILQHSNNTHRCGVGYFNRILQSLDRDDVETEDLCALFLLDNQISCDGYKEQFGVLCFTALDICKNPYFFKGTAEMYEKSTAADEFKRCVEPLSTPCNSLIIIDPYLFANKYNINNVFIPLLSRILPSPISNGTFKIPFHISLFCHSCFFIESDKDAINDIVDKDAINDIVAKISEIRKGVLDIYFTIYHIEITRIIKHDNNTDAKNTNSDYVTGDFHSRHILTNSMMVNSADGFDIFVYDKNKKRLVCGKWARIEFVWPAFDDNTRKDTDNYYRWLEICSENTRAPQKCKCLGTWKIDCNRWEKHPNEIGNRLFNLIKRT